MEGPLVAWIFELSEEDVLKGTSESSKGESSCERRQLLVMKWDLKIFVGIVQGRVLSIIWISDRPNNTILSYQCI